MNDSARIQQQIKRLAGGEPAPRSALLEKALSEFGLAWHDDGGNLILDEPLELLDGPVIREQLSASADQAVSDIMVHWAIGSTNTWMMENEHRADWHGLVCLAEQQVSGRGRRGRGWVSPFGKSVYMSVGWTMPRQITGLSGLSLVAGMQVVRALRSLGIDDCWLKWPNDVLMAGGKLAGILVELTAPNRGRVGMVVGIGVNMRLDPGEMAGVDQRWSMVSQVREISRNVMVATILNNLLPALSRFEAGGFSVFHQDWDGFDLFRGRVVTVHLGDDAIQGVNKGIDEDGNLLVETEKGVETFSAGEVSLREG